MPSARAQRQTAAPKPAPRLARRHTPTMAAHSGPAGAGSRAARPPMPRTCRGAPLPLRCARLRTARATRTPARSSTLTLPPGTGASAPPPPRCLVAPLCAARRRIALRAWRRGCTRARAPAESAACAPVFSRALIPSRCPRGHPPPLKYAPASALRRPTMLKMKMGWPPRSSLGRGVTKPSQTGPNHHKRDNCSVTDVQLTKYYTRKHSCLRRNGEPF